MNMFSKIGGVFFSCLMCVCLVACHDDDEFLGDKNSAFYVNNLAGTWELSWSKGQSAQDGEWDEAQEGSFRVFNDDRTGYNYTSQDSLKKYFIWKIVENKLSIKDQGEQKFQMQTIDQLNDQEMVLTLEYEGYKGTETYKKIIVNDSIPATDPKE